MTRLFRRLVIALAAVSPLCVPLSSEAESVLDFSIRNENRLAMTMLSDAFSDSEVTFSASQENGVTEIQIDLDGQSIYVRRSQGELYIHSSKNTDRTFSTLSEDEKVVLGTMAGLMEESLDQDNRFYAATVCVMMHFADWPSEMPLMVSLDPVQLRMGDLRLDREEMKEARRQALAKADAQQEEAPGRSAGWVSLCDVIGTMQTACYPTSLIPYIEKCDTKLVGGKQCRARCGTTCSGLCPGFKYTQDCFNHDRCVVVYSMTNRKCNAIFAFAFDDCISAPNCRNHFAGVWDVDVVYDNGESGTGTWYVYPDGTFADNVGAAGSWTRVADAIEFDYATSPGCRPVYTGFLGDTTLELGGWMECREWPRTGDWWASKRGLPLPTMPSIQSLEHRNNGPAGLTGGRAPSPTDSTVNPPLTKAQD
ncbi:MAG: hypothetical protein HYX75_20010 [Acidobacteria bacterium]|nr:hypothetical protein [Acidobacteriota bacterium]